MAHQNAVRLPSPAQEEGLGVRASGHLAKKG
jgi:hypothetical protein